jgi:hypothetical protein
MPIRASQSADPVRKLGRWVDMRVQVQLADVEARAADGTWRTITSDTTEAERAELDGSAKRWKAGPAEVLGTFGGVWDRKRKRWARRHPLSCAVLVYKIHRGQEEAGAWLVDWLRRWGTGDWHDVRRAWSALLIGGRRSGKSHLAVLALLLFATMKRGSLTWVVSPTIDTGAELDQALGDLIPAAWKAERVAATNGKSTTYHLPNGSTITLKSGVKPERLKAGRVDFAVINEAQLQKHAGYVKLRGAITDRGGIVLMTANPPDSAIGVWVEEHYLRATRAEIDGVAFQVDPFKNPWIVLASLTSQRAELDDKTFNREVRGLFEPIGDVVFHAWRWAESLRDPWAALVDVTRELTARLLGKAVDELIGMDFQLTPHMAATAVRLYRDPDGDPLEFYAFVVDEWLIENGDEDDLLDAIEATDRWKAPAVKAGEEPVRHTGQKYAAAGVAIVADASAWFQDSAHHRGQRSDQRLSRRGWRAIYKPQADSDRNPEIRERCKLTNASLKVATGRRRLFVARHCLETATAIAKWENKNGVPYRRSVYAHLCDAVSYVVFRLRARPRRKATPGAGTVRRRPSRGAELREIDSATRSREYRDRVEVDRAAGPRRGSVRRLRASAVF